MFEGAKDQLSQELDAIRDAPASTRTSASSCRTKPRRLRSPRGVGPQLLREQLPRALQQPGAHRGRERRHGPVRLRAFRCGSSAELQDQHKRLEDAVSTFLGTEDTILYTSCFDANAGLFETILGPEDAIISDALNHASIIDGIRLCKAKRMRFAHMDMEDLEAKLREAQAAGCPKIMIATDGVFSMDGDIAPLEAICDLAEQYGAMVMVDDSSCHWLYRQDGPRKHRALRRHGAGRCDLDAG